MNPNLKLALARTMSVTGFFSLLEKSLQGRGALVFNLHRVLPLAESGDCYNPNLALTPESLERFIQFLKKRLPVVPLTEVVDATLKGKVGRMCALTFDDGWEDNYRIAFPILKGTPFTIFIPTEMIGSKKLLPEERFWKVMNGPHVEKRAAQLRTRLVSARLLPPEAESLGTFLKMRDRFKQLDYTGKMDFLSEAEASLGIGEPEKSSFITWDQAREMQAHGVTFGSHTRRHTILPVNPVEFMRSELEGSKEKIKAEIGSTPDFFAYPNGIYDATSISVVGETGFRAAFTTEQAVVTSSANQFALPRVPLSNDMVNNPMQVFSKSLAELLMVKSYMAQGEPIDY